MKLPTRSRHGSRLMLDMAQHHNEGTILLGDIAKRQAVSMKYLEQIIIGGPSENHPSRAPWCGINI